MQVQHYGLGRIGADGAEPKHTLSRECQMLLEKR